jgi:preprotein translocase subunit SecY
VFIAVVATISYVIPWLAGITTLGFAGTSLLIAVGVALELMRQIDSQLTLRNYEGFLK